MKEKRGIVGLKPENCRIDYKKGANTKAQHFIPRNIVILEVISYELIAVYATKLFTRGRRTIDIWGNQTTSKIE
jgi:hypothetical protein